MPIDPATGPGIRRGDYMEVVPTRYERTHQEVNEHPGHIPFEPGKGVGDHANSHCLGRVAVAAFRRQLVDGPPDRAQLLTGTSQHLADKPKPEERDARYDEHHHQVE